MRRRIDRRSRARALSALVLICLAIPGIAQRYPVSAIAPELLQTANAVVREHEVTHDLRNLTRVEGRSRLVITVLNEAGDRFATMDEYYDQFNSVEKIEGWLYGADGKEIRSLKKNEIRDRPYTSENFAMDLRIKSHDFYYRKYPYTVEYIVETVSRETMFLPGWNPLIGQGVALEHGSFIIRTPEDYKIRYRCSGGVGDPAIGSEKKQRSYTWTASALPAVYRGRFAPAWSSVAPYVSVDATDFQMGNYTGNMNTWQEYGRFALLLNQGRDQLPAKIREKVAGLISGITDPFQKAKILYRFLQQSTRYISIQLGLGGWQPFDADYVATKGYGDCKALSNYMYALLKEAGVRSHYTLIRGGADEEDVQPDFPSSRFNHAILCVPGASDTLWLECTSQTVAPGYLGSFTGNRHALVITETGGVLVRTPSYPLQKNRQQRRYVADLREDGSMELKVTTLYTGLQQDRLHSLLNQLSKEKVQEVLQEQLDLATYEVKDFRYQQHEGLVPEISEELDLSVQAYSNRSGKRLFIQPNVLTRSDIRLRLDSTRKHHLRMGEAYLDEDSVVINLPAGFKPESVPADLRIENEFGQFQASTRITGSQLIYYRRSAYTGGTFPAAAYNELAKMCESVYKADRAKVVLVRETDR